MNAQDTLSSEHGLIRQFLDNLSLAAEWLQIYTNRPAWAYFDLEESQTERQFQLALRFQFDRAW